MNYIFDNEKPIYIQLVEAIRNDIISGKFKPGEKLPSVRDFSLNAKVNPNTVQKALAELETQKLIYTERTNGKFVTTDEHLIYIVQFELAHKIFEKFVSDMESIGLNHGEAFSFLEDFSNKDLNKIE